MANFRIALGNVRFPSSKDESVAIVVEAIRSAAEKKADIVCFPENQIPGYRIGSQCPAPPQEWLDEAWGEVDRCAAKHQICVILGTERVENGETFLTARVTGSDGALLGFQDKVQLDPSEEATYVAGTGRRTFSIGELTFGIVICHEGWRYPETVRWAARKGAHVVFHPHAEIVEDPTFCPTQFADPSNTFHEKAALCRAAENSCYFATVNCALPGACTTSAVVAPDGNLLAHQPYGQEGILVVDIDTQNATGLLASRLRNQ